MNVDADIAEATLHLCAVHIDHAQSHETRDVPLYVGVQLLIFLNLCYVLLSALGMPIGIHLREMVDQLVFLKQELVLVIDEQGGVDHFEIVLDDGFDLILDQSDYLVMMVHMPDLVLVMSGQSVVRPSEVMRGFHTFRNYSH